jgi:hypothetical protein
MALMDLPQHVAAKAELIPEAVAEVANTVVMADPE